MKKIFKLLIFLLVIYPLTSFGAIDFEHGNFTAENVKIEQKLGNNKEFKPATLINFKTGYRVAVYSNSQAQRYFSLGYELDKGLLGFSVVTNYSTTLSSSITATQTTIPVGTTKDKKGEQLATSTLGMKIYLNIEPGGNKEELVVCTGISGNSWTGCTRGLAFSGTDESAVSSYQYAHSAGSRVVMSNIHYVYQNFVDIDSNQTVGGDKTFTGTSTFQGGVSHFTNIPTTSTTTPSSNNQLATKLYVDSVAISGGANASTSTKGISYLSSDPSVYTNPIALNSEEVATTTGANKVVRASSTGFIDSSFIDQTADYTWSGTTTFSGTLIGAASPWGDGSDGDVTISADTSLSRDMFYNNLTVNNGITLDTNGFKVFVKNTINTIGTGKLASNGKPNSEQAYTTGTLPIPPTGADGGAGGAFSSSGSPGESGVAFDKSLMPIGTTSANGGIGGTATGPGGSAGTGATVTSNPLSRPYSIGTYTSLFDLINGVITMYSTAPSAGGGGGSGGTGGSSNAPGGGKGGSVGGFVWIAAKNIVNLNVESKGGQGSPGGTDGANGGGGGGGGGNGGFILVFYATKTTTSYVVTGGLGGLAGAGGGATNGQAGNAGAYKEIQF